MNDPLEPDEKVLVCSVIVTAEYIIETTQQLEAKLKEKVDRGLADSIRFVFYIPAIESSKISKGPFNLIKPNYFKKQHSSSKDEKIIVDFYCAPCI